MAEIRFEHVSKSFDANLVVQDLDLQIADGELMVLVGPQAAARRPPCACSPASRT